MTAGFNFWVDLGLAMALVGRRMQTRHPGEPCIAGCEIEEKTMSIKDTLLAFIREEEGLTAVEYAVAGGLVSLAVVAAFTNLGTAITARIQALIDAIS